jgi:membrane-associated phospholipid phosphatase
MRPRLANFASNVLNPMLLGLVAVILMSLGYAESTSAAIFLSLVILALGLLPVYLLALYLVRTGRMDSVFNNSRQQRRGIYVGGVITTLVTILVISLMDAPTEVVATLVTVLAAGILFTVINNWWKISIHAAFATGVAMLLIYLYGWPAFIIALPLVPLVVWSRVELGQHTAGQVTAGMLVAAAIQPSVFYLFGLY